MVDYKTKYEKMKRTLYCILEDRLSILEEELKAASNSYPIDGNNIEDIEAQIAHFKCIMDEYFPNKRRK